MSASAINSARVASLRIVWSPHRNSFSGFATATVPAVHTCHCTVCTNILWFHRGAYWIALCNLSQHQATRPDVPYQTDSWDAGCSNGGYSDNLLINPECGALSKKINIPFLFVNCMRASSGIDVSRGCNGDRCAQLPNIILSWLELLGGLPR